jgi:hypothetical protein
MNKIDMDKVKYIRMGREAFERGFPRSPETDNPEQARLWVIGYDIAKLTAHIE